MLICQKCFPKWNKVSCYAWWLGNSATTALFKLHLFIRNNFIVLVLKQVWDKIHHGNQGTEKFFYSSWCLLIELAWALFKFIHYTSLLVLLRVSQSQLTLGWEAGYILDESTVPHSADIYRKTITHSHSLLRMNQGPSCCHYTFCVLLKWAN